MALFSVFKKKYYVMQIYMYVYINYVYILLPLFMLFTQLSEDGRPSFCVLLVEKWLSCCYLLFCCWCWCDNRKGLGLRCFFVDDHHKYSAASLSLLHGLIDR